MRGQHLLRTAPTLLIAFALSALIAAGCGSGTFTIGIGDASASGSFNDNGNSNDNNQLDNTIRVRFANFSTTNAVRVQFFVSAEPGVIPPDELFVQVFDVTSTSSIGVAGSGIIGPESDDEIEIDCRDNLIIGTLGGEFLNDNSGEVVGQGGQARWLVFGGQFDCGATVTYSYRSSGGFSVTQDVE